MKYAIKWGWKYNSFSKAMISEVSCELYEHGSIEAFYFLICEKDGNKNYRFEIKTITDRTDCKESCYINSVKTKAIQKKVNSEFQNRKLKLNSWSSEYYLNLLDATKESTIACATVLFRLIYLSKEDQNKITEFLKTGILSQQQILEILLAHISKNEISEALDKAILLEKRGYNGILLEVLIEWLGKSNNVEVNTKILNTMLKSNVSLAVIEYLLTLKIDWSYLNDDGWPLIHAAWSLFPNAIPSMIKAGANINQFDKYGNTLMHIIAAKEVSNLQLAKLKSLFENEANPTLRAPHSNMTPYQLAYMRNNHIIAEHIADYTKQFKGPIDPINTIEAQLEQIRACQEREKPDEKMLTRLQELELAQQQLQKEKAELLTKLNQQPISLADYDRQDYALIKAMLNFYTDKIAEFPAQASELLFKVSVPSIKTETEINLIIKNAFEGSMISDIDRGELSVELKEINNFAIKDRKQLKLRSQVEYKADNIANMVCEAAKDLVLEKQTTASKTNIKSQQALQSVVEILKKTNSPLHRPRSNSSNYTEAPNTENKVLTLGD